MGWHCWQHCATQRALTSTLTVIYIKRTSCYMPLAIISVLSQSTCVAKGGVFALHYWSSPSRMHTPACAALSKEGWLKDCCVLWCPAELVEVMSPQNGKGLGIKAGFSRENNGPGADSPHIIATSLLAVAQHCHSCGLSDRWTCTFCSVIIESSRAHTGHVQRRCCYQMLHAVKPIAVQVYCLPNQWVQSALHARAVVI